MCYLLKAIRKGRQGSRVCLVFFDSAIYVIDHLGLTVDCGLEGGTDRKVVHQTYGFGSYIPFQLRWRIPQHDCCPRATHSTARASNLSEKACGGFVGDFRSDRIFQTYNRR